MIETARHTKGPRTVHKTTSPSQPRPSFEVVSAITPTATPVNILAPSQTVVRPRGRRSPFQVRLASPNNLPSLASRQLRGCFSNCPRRARRWFYSRVLALHHSDLSRISSLVFRISRHFWWPIQSHPDAPAHLIGRRPIAIGGILAGQAWLLCLRLGAYFVFRVSDFEFSPPRAIRFGSRCRSRITLRFQPPRSIRVASFFQKVQASISDPLGLTHRGQDSLRTAKIETSPLTCPIPIDNIEPVTI
jgi:hypothetical protein